MLHVIGPKYIPQISKLQHLGLFHFHPHQILVYHRFGIPVFQVYDEYEKKSEVCAGCLEGGGALFQIRAPSAYTGIQNIRLIGLNPSEYCIRSKIHIT